MKNSSVRSIIACIKRSALAYFLHSVYLWCVIRIKKTMLYFYRGSNRQNDFRISEEEAYELVCAARPNISKGDSVLPKKCNDDVLVSIIVPVYNAVKYLEKCLESLKNQETIYKYEVVCVNDGSTDGSGEILDKYKNVDFFRVITQENRGHSGARNTGLSVPLGKYVMFVDSDDYVSPDYVNQLVLCAINSKADIVVSDYKKCTINDKILRKYHYLQKSYSNFFDYTVFDGVAWGKLYKSELWEGVRFPEKLMFEDTIIFNVIFRRCNKIAVCEEGCYFYRIHGNNTIDRLMGSPMLLDSIWVVRKALELSSELGVDNTEDYLSYLLLQCSTHLFYRIEGFPENIQRAVFKLACACITEYCSKLKEKEWHFNDIVLEKLILCFEKEDFHLWKKCSKVYPSNHITIRKGIT